MFEPGPNINVWLAVDELKQLAAISKNLCCLENIVCGLIVTRFVSSVAMLPCQALATQNLLECRPVVEDDLYQSRSVALDLIPIVK